MEYQSELLFFQKLLSKFFVNTHIISSSNDYMIELPFELRYLIQGLIQPLGPFQESLKNIKSNNVYRIVDEYYCSYILFRLPNQSIDCYFLIGPYLQKPVTKLMMLDWVDKFSIPHSLFGQLEKFYTDLPLITDDSNLFAIVYTLGEQLWGELDNFSLQYIDLPSKNNSDSYNHSSVYNEVALPHASPTRNASKGFPEEI